MGAVGALGAKAALLGGANGLACGAPLTRRRGGGYSGVSAHNRGAVTGRGATKRRGTADRGTIKRSKRRGTKRSARQMRYGVAFLGGHLVLGSSHTVYAPSSLNGPDAA